MLHSHAQVKSVIEYPKCTIEARESCLDIVLLKNITFKVFAASNTDISYFDSLHSKESFAHVKG